MGLTIQSQTIQLPYHVPEEQFTFINAAIKEGILVPGKLLNIHIEIDSRNRNAWIKIDEV